MSKKHAKLSASGSAKWLNCPGSVQAEAPYPNKGNAYAEEGTVAHEVADLCLKEGVDATEFIGWSLKDLKLTDEIKYFDKDFIVDAEMAEYVQEYIDYVRSHETPDSILFTEERVDFSHVVKDGFGTLDSSVLIPESKTCHIFDLKYGKGVLVEAYQNTQAQLYALGLLNDLSFLYDIEKFVIHIAQPRKDSFSAWEITVEELSTFEDEAKKAAKLALSKNPPRIPGDKQCQWCLAKGDCKAISDKIQNLLKVDFDDIKDKESLDPNKLTLEEKANILKASKFIEAHLKQIAGEALTILQSGEEYPEHHLVEGRSNAQYTEEAEEALINKLGEEKAYNKKLIGLTDARKLCGKKYIDEITFKPEGSPTVAHISDPRKPINVKSIKEQLEDGGDDVEDL